MKDGAAERVAEGLGRQLQKGGAAGTQRAVQKEWRCRRTSRQSFGTSAVVALVALPTSANGVMSSHCQTPSLLRIRTLVSLGARGILSVRRAKAKERSPRPSAPRNVSRN